MIESITIFDLDTAQAVTGGYDHTFTAWLSAADPTNKAQLGIISSRLIKRNIPHFVRYFLDQDDSAQNVEFEGPTEQDIMYYTAALSRLHKEPTKHRVAINCSAGISRSTALGIIGWMVAGFAPEIALDKILKARKYAWPNTRILRLYDKQFGTQSSNCINKWKETTLGKLVT